MAIVRVSRRGYKFLRNSGLFLLGALIVLLSVMMPRISKDSGEPSLLAGSDVVFADGPNTPPVGDGGGPPGDGVIGDGGGGIIGDGGGGDGGGDCCY